MDQKLFFLINHDWTSSALDRLMATLSCLDCWTPMLLILIVAAAVFGGFKLRAMLLTLLLTVAITDGMLVNSLKHWVNRPRPKQVMAARVVDLAKAKPRLLAVGQPPVIKISVPETGTIQGRSFPSGHTSDNFAALAVLIAFYPRRGWLYFPIALGVAYSRIYVGAHWPSDVLASICLGFALGWLGVVLAEWLWRRLGSRIAPALYQRHPCLLVKETLKEEASV